MPQPTDAEVARWIEQQFSEIERPAFMDSMPRPELGAMSGEALEEERAYWQARLDVALNPPPMPDEEGGDSIPVRAKDSTIRIQRDFLHDVERELSGRA